jgi:hypothetical protein
MVTQRHQNTVEVVDLKGPTKCQSASLIMPQEKFIYHKKINV